MTMGPENMHEVDVDGGDNANINAAYLGPFDLGDEDVDIVTRGHALYTQPTTGQAVSVSQLVNNGAVIDLDHQPDTTERRAAEEIGQSLWWTKEQLEECITNNHASDIFPNGDWRVTDWTELKTDMVPLITGEQDGEVLIYKRLGNIGYGPHVIQNSTITYHCESYYEGSQEPYDSSILRHKPFLSRLNVDFLLPGLYGSLLSMRVGEKSAFIINPRAGYGQLGCPPRIPPNAEILLVVQVLKLMEEGTLGDYLTMDEEERARVPFEKVLEMADTERKSGNGYFVEGKKKEAGVRYQRAIRVLEGRSCQTREEEEKMKEILLKLYCNVSNTFCFLNRPYGAMSFCKRALDIDPNCVKALYFYGKAKLNAGDYEDAKRYLLKARSFKPDNQEISRELTRLDRRLDADRMTSRELDKKMSVIFRNGN